MSGFDWPALMRAGMVGLRLPPDQFWALTPAELQLMLGPGDGARPMLSKGLEALMAAWPDETHKDARE
ncbi:MAG: rcc01693 family protein [Pseudomonadota bacterium]